ncbi:MAG: hypothetical protein IMF07_04290 [Proteobacteria bacterium]|nr:hypothetical protein [Pseudomonadota bacterium]
MTKINRLIFAVLILAVFNSGCLYAKLKTPLDIDVSTTEMGQKTGEASIYSVLWLVAWGDASTAAAADNGDISIINHMDEELFSILFGLYTKRTTIVYGD